MSQRSREAVLAVLAKHYTQVGVTIVDSVTDLEALATGKPDLVFLGMKFVPLDPALGLLDPKKVWISQFLDRHDITYTGSGRRAQELELNKPLAKQRMIDAGLKTSPFCVAPRSKLMVPANFALTYPLFVKPTNRGGGLGIDSDSLVHDSARLKGKVESIASRLQSDSLIEEYLPGREFSVAILKSEHFNHYSAMPIEKIASPDKNGTRILSRQVKSADAVGDLEVVDQVIKAGVTTLAVKAFRALGARDYGRIDIRLDALGVPHFLEANLLPSLIEGYGSFPKACGINQGIDYESMILTLVRLALARQSNGYETIPKSRTLTTTVFG